MKNAEWVRLGAVLGGLAVAFGAFGAHGLKERLTVDLLAIFETGVRYHMYHALALIGLGLSGRASRSTTIAGWSFLAGVVLFSGSLYLLALSGLRWLGAITPLGGVAFLVGWAAMVVSAGTSTAKDTLD